MTSCVMAFGRFPHRAKILVEKVKAEIDNEIANEIDNNIDNDIDNIIDNGNIRL